MRNAAPIPEADISKETNDESMDDANSNEEKEEFLTPADPDEDLESQEYQTPRNMELELNTSESKSQVSFVTTQTNSEITSELKNLRATFDDFIRNNQKNLDGNKALEKLEKQAAESSYLSQANAKLQEKNDRLQQDALELSTKLSAEREKLLLETARFKEEIANVQEENEGRASELEKAKNDLLAKVEVLENDKSALATEIDTLEAQYNAATMQLDEVRKEAMVLKEAAGEEQRSKNEVNDELVLRNEEISCQLEELKAKVESMDEEIQGYKETIANLETMLEESEDQLKRAFDEMKSQGDAENDLKLRISQYEETIKKLELDLQALRQEQEEERANFQMLNEQSSEAYEQMKKSIEDKEGAIKSLKEALHRVEENLANEVRRVNDANDAKEGQASQLLTRIRELESSLLKTSDELQQSNLEKEDLEKKLADAIERIQRADELQDKVTSDNAAKSAALETVNGENKSMMQRIKELEELLKKTKEERDDAFCRMQTFDNREEDLFKKLREGDRVRRGLHNRVMQLSGNIRVYVRVRPTIPGEEDSSAVAPKCAKRKREEPVKENLFNYPGMGGESNKKSRLGADDPTKNILEVTEPKKDRGGLSERRKKWKFGFDNVFNPMHGQEDIWEATAPLVQSAIDGYNVTIFAYGQTGSGKTYTMLGEDANEGLITRSVRKLFAAKKEIEELTRGESRVELSVELLEVYNEKVRDLLATSSGADGKEIMLKLTGNEVVGNVILPAENETGVRKILNLAQKRRCVKATASNAVSSRSHMLFTIHFKVSTSGGSSREGKINICDLAGSERLGKSNANEQVKSSLLKETKHINTSLSVLSNVIEKLQSGGANIPFRESKLTYLLQNSLGGNSKTLAIVCCNPLQSHFHESLCSLRFASKVSKVDLKAVANFSC